MDDLTVQTGQNKKRFGVSSIRKLGKFLGLGGSATKSETKSQIDDYEVPDQINPPSNGIDRIMALSPQERSLAVMAIIEPDVASRVSPSPTTFGGFKPKTLPTPRNRGQELGNDISFSSLKESDDLKDITVEIKSVSPVPPTHNPLAPPQRVEDIIRQKIPLHRRNSKLTSTDSTEDRIETKETAARNLEQVHILLSIVIIDL